jgi:hypothetical protein
MQRPWVAVLLAHVIGWYLVGLLPADTILWPALAVRAAAPGTAPDFWLAGAIAAALVQSLVVGGLLWLMLPRMASRTIRLPWAVGVAALGAAVPLAATVYLASALPADPAFTFISLGALAAGVAVASVAVIPASEPGVRALY